MREASDCIQFCSYQRRTVPDTERPRRSSSRADGACQLHGPSPTYLEFAYLAFTIGMTFQVSHTNLEVDSIRATALRHGLLSFLFGSVILSTTINLIAGLAAQFRCGSVQ
jgi:uncharacterized membrane protein